MGAIPISGVNHDLIEEPHISEPRINDRIRVPEVRLVGPSGEQVGVVRLEVALSLAQEADLDLVEVAPDARPPVCKLMDYGKFKYESDMKARDARRNQANTVLKEIRFRLKIDAHDYETKKGHVERFLSAGDKVKVMIMFRGREQSRPEMGARLLQRLAEDISELGFIESAPKQDGRNMIMVVGPVKKKAETKSEQRRRREDGGVNTRAERQQKRQAAAEERKGGEQAEVVAAEPEVLEAEPVAVVESPAPVVEATPAVEATEAAAPVVKAPAAKPAVAKSAATKPVAKPAAETAAKPATPKPRPKSATPKPAAKSAPKSPAKPAAPRKTSAKPAPKSE
ncbi:translation initiation factor IF-3 [Timonella senegalensis]|uniref:translation initiation factor IF-3 n=1 Tax=Timonella senegalensis TaxID=1465825 RepID=UPI002FE22CC6